MNARGSSRPLLTMRSAIGDRSHQWMPISGEINSAKLIIQMPKIQVFKYRKFNYSNDEFVKAEFDRDSAVSRLTDFRENNPTLVLTRWTSNATRGKMSHFYFLLQTVKETQIAARSGNVVPSRWKKRTLWNNTWGVGGTQPHKRRWNARDDWKWVFTQIVYWHDSSCTSLWNAWRNTWWNA